MLDGQQRTCTRSRSQAQQCDDPLPDIQNFGAPEKRRPRRRQQWHKCGLADQSCDCPAQRGRRGHARNGNALAYSCLEDNGQYGFQGAAARALSLITTRSSATTPTTGKPGSTAAAVTGARSSGASTGSPLPTTMYTTTSGRGCGPTPTTAPSMSNTTISPQPGRGHSFMRSATTCSWPTIRLSITQSRTGPDLGGFPDGAVYISESGADPRVPGPYRRTLAITDNVFLDNWSGVVLWESADRFCGHRTTRTPIIAL